MKATVDKISSESIAKTFAESAYNYHKKAEIQRKVANGLMSSLLPWKDSIPEGPILEVGSGTGFLSELLIREFPEREIVLSDLSEGMLQFCEQELSKSNPLSELISFELLDVNELQNEEQKYGLIVSNFAAQWFDDTALGLERLSGLLKPGGLLLCTFPGNHSFEEWYSCCLELGLPFTANPLPDVEEVVIKLSMGPLQIDYYENDLYQEFDGSMSFFRHLKDIGVSESRKGNPLSYKQLKLLTEFWDDKSKQGVSVKWHIVYLAAKKEYS